MINSFISYIKLEKRYSEKTCLAYKSDLEQFQSYLQDQYEIRDLGNAEHLHVRSWVVWMLDEGYVNRTLHRKVSSLKSFYKFLKKTRRSTHNPTTKIIVPKIGSRLPHYVKQSEMNEAKLRTVLEREEGNSFENIRDRLIIELLYQCGLRRSELIQLRDDTIDFEKKYIKVRGKGNKDRLVPVGDDLLADVRSYMDVRDSHFDLKEWDALLVTDRGRVLYPKFVYNLVKSFLEQVSTVEKKSPHVLRHSFATHLSNEGADINAIKSILGHSSLASTQVYVHTNIEKLKASFGKAHPRA